MAGGMQEVTFDEGEPRTDAVPPEPVRSASARRRVVVAVGVVVVAALVAVGTQRVLDERRAEADATLAVRHADAAGVVAPFDAGVRAHPGPAPDVRTESLATVDGTMVGLRQRDGWSLVGLHPDDWSSRWETPVPRVLPRERPYWIEDEDLDALAGPRDIDPLAVAGALGGDPWCVRAGGDRPLAVCGLQYGALVLGAPLSSTWWVVDATSGEVVRTGTAGPAEWVGMTGDALVRVHGIDTAGHDAGSERPAGWAVEATDPTTGDTRWTWDAPPTDAPSDSPSAAGTPGDPEAMPSVVLGTTRLGRVLVWLGETAWVLDHHGRVVEEVSVPQGEGVALGRNGRAGLVGGRVTGDDGFVRQETLAQVAIDDGTLPDDVLVMRSGLAGADMIVRSSDGRDRWISPLPRLPLAVLDSDVLVRTHTGLARLGGPDGTVVWSVESGVDADVVVTDGRTLLVRVGDTLRALAWSTGEVEWERTLADVGLAGEIRSVRLDPALRRLVASFDDELRVLP
ncbi:hypothetical protein ACFO3K_11245 [Cellulomonas algicola]|uniref:hypothetical protein n=1 Tax=Cellulomonas algicola TaxID=2071633 RepID=UPI001C3FE606|nr:hypothetical protein [Cellulomonas algicola]